MLKCFVTVSFGLLSLYSAGQASNKFSFKLGSEYELPKKTEDLAFFGNEKEGIINLSLKKEELNILRFSPPELNKTFEQHIDLTAVTKNFDSELVADFNNGKYYWLHSDWDKNSGREELFYDRIDIARGKRAETDQKMFETSRLAGVPASNGFYKFKISNKYGFEYNSDRNKLLVHYRLHPEQRNDKRNYDKIGLQVFDDNMKKSWGREYTMPYTEAVMDNSGFTIDANGVAYLLAKVYDSDSRKERDKETGKPAYRYELLVFSANTEKMTIVPISVGDYYIREATLTESSQKKMIVACTYSKNPEGNGTDGVFLAMFDENNKLVEFKKGYYEFPVEELAKFESARQRRKMERKDDYEAANLLVRNVVLEKDGSIFIACEEFRVVETTTTTTSSNNAMQTRVTYYFDDILGCKINAEGKFQWLKKIPKRQVGSSGNATLGFKLVSDETGYYFLYLDNKKNMNLPNDEVPKVHVDGMGGQVVVSKLSNDGALTKELVFDTREEEIKIFPRQFHRINKNQFIGRATLKRNLYRPLLITVN